MKFRFRPKLRTVLLLLNILVLLLPACGVAILRLYESELVKQTESELISQATLTASMFREIYLKQLDEQESDPESGKPASRTTPRSPSQSDKPEYTPLPPQLDLAEARVRPPAPLAFPPKTSPDALAVAAGKELNSALINARRIVLSGIRIVDKNGIVVATTSGEAGQSLAAREEVVKALAGTPTSLLRVRNSDELPPSLSSISRRARVRVFVAMPVAVGDRIIGAVVSSRTPLDAAKALYLIRDHLLKSAIGLFLMVVLMAMLTAYYINRPVKALIRQSQRLQEGEGAEPLENPGIQEVAQLSEAIARMATTLEERASYIRTFATNVSHEFKTPLTSIHGSIEILKDHYQEMSREERERFLEMIDLETVRLDRLVRRLLELARAENFSSVTAQTDAIEALEDLAARYRRQGLAINVTCDAGAICLRMTREAFESIVGNLTENARQHAGPGVTVAITGKLVQNAEGKVFELVVADDGPGVSAGDRDRIFAPFFTTARATGGSGLGLSIAQALLRSHGGSIVLEPGDRGAVFRLEVPVV